MTNPLTIVTNKQPREMMAKFQLPAAALGDFDYIKEEDSFTPRLVQYRGAWYDVHDSMRIEPGRHPSDNPLKGWHSCISETFSSGVLFRLVDDDGVICGRYYA